MGKCITYINGHFFEYDCDKAGDLTERPLEGVQYRIVTDLATEPVSVEFFKQHARIDFDTDDNLLEEYIKAARQELERYSQLSFGEKTIKLMALRLPKNYRLMFGPVNAITSPTDLTLFGDIVKDAKGDDVEITYTTSWTGQGGLPLAIKVAICQHAAGLYINRENVLTGMNAGTLFDQALKTMDRYKNVYLV